MEIENEEEQQIVETIPTKKVVKNENLPWVEKYRPSKLIDLISHDSIIQTCKFDMFPSQFKHLYFKWKNSLTRKNYPIFCFMVHLEQVKPPQWLHVPNRCMVRISTNPWFWR